MQQLLVIFIICTLSPVCQTQTLNETKGYLFDKIRANNPLPNEKNEVYYNITITKENAALMANRQITTAEFPYLFIYGYTHYMSGTEDWEWAVYNTFDIRDMSTISLDRKVGKNNFYVLTIDLLGKFPANNHLINRYSAEAKNEKTSTILIGLSDNKDAVEKIKKAFLHLGKLVGNTPTDKDIF